MKKLFYIFLIFPVFFIFFSCEEDPNGQSAQANETPNIPELEKLKADEQSLQDEIDLLRRRIRSADDSDDISDLNDEQDQLKKELVALEEQLRQNQNQQQDIEQEVEDNPFCQRTAAVRQLIMKKIKDGAINDEIEDCRGVTDFMISQITEALVLRVRELKAGDLDDLRGVTSIDLSDNKMSSLPSGIFDDLVNLVGDDAVKLTGNAFSSLPSGIFDNLKKYNADSNNYGLDILTEQLEEFEEFDEFDSTHDDSILPDLDVAKDPGEATACDSYKGVCREDENNDGSVWTLRTDPACEEWDWNAVRYRHNEFKSYLNAFNGLTKPYLYE
ncbi:MAG: hypothetical protein OXH36_00045, partial [Bdellovibrionales bacterium]|nr:hypothetical protein [Bdellovibrionales bacterium]